uniref:Pipecolic acid oxidase n=1 Tax=Sinocyclocheilus rhinocerous TaxID=307959 RepID=A0A673LA73_9TELE
MEMSSEIYDCIVIGAGIQGSAGQKQFVLPHSRGSSHGQTRVIRKTYEEDFYVQMMQESYELWAQLEREAGNGEGFSHLKATMQRHKIPTVFLEKQEFSQHIPNVNLTDGNGALIDTHAGVLYADRALRAVQVNKIWLQTSLLKAPFTLSREYGHFLVKINVCYWKEKIPGTYSVGQRFPCFIEMESKEGEYDIYGLPSNEYPGLMKVSDRRDTEPDERDKQTDRGDIDILVRYVTRCLPGLVPVPAVVESCMYMVTPDRNFVLDSHSTYGNTIIGAGFSGHGLKFGPIIGKLLSQLAMGQVPSYDLSPFRIQRFMPDRHFESKSIQ